MLHIAYTYRTIPYHTIPYSSQPLRASHAYVFIHHGPFWLSSLILLPLSFLLMAPPRTYLLTDSQLAVLIVIVYICNDADADTDAQYIAADTVFLRTIHRARMIDTCGYYLYSSYLFPLCLKHHILYLMFDDPLYTCRFSKTAGLEVPGVIVWK